MQDKERANRRDIVEVIKKSEMGKDISDAYTYRVGHPLAQYLLAKAKRQDTSDTVGIVFNYTDSPVECKGFFTQIKSNKKK